MKALVSILILLSWLGGHAQYTVQPDTTKQLHTDKQLESFLDSIGHLSSLGYQIKYNEPPIDTSGYYESVYKRLLSTVEFEKLKASCKSKKIDIVLAKSVFGDSNIESQNNLKDTIALNFYSFDKDTFDFDEYAIALGEDPKTSHGCVLYFFKNNHCIDRQEAESFYGLTLNHYKDSVGKTIIYYERTLSHGSDHGWGVDEFYKYDNDRLTYILGDVAYIYASLLGGRIFYFQSTLFKTSPLTFKWNYFQGIVQNDWNTDTIVCDSTFMQCKLDITSKSLNEDYSHSKMNMEQRLSYTWEDNDRLFVHAYYKELKAALNNPAKHRDVALYLSSLKEQYNNTKK